MRPLPSVLKEKALGSVSSCPTLSMEEVGLASLLQGLRSCSLLSLWKKLSNLTSADHDGAGRGGLDDPREKPAVEGG